MEIFLSYCQKDKLQADSIDDHFNKTAITIKRDIRDIKNWKSIKSYMQTVRDTDYVIMIITENYLKSEACMYEALEAMKEKDFQNKIFPVVVDRKIYNSSWRIPIIKYWEDKYAELKKEIMTVQDTDAGPLHQTLKNYQNIASNISEFISTVADMNNPSYEDAAEAIDNFLKIRGLNFDNPSVVTNTNLFQQLDLNSLQSLHRPTDQEKHSFAKKGFIRIISNLEILCHDSQFKASPYDFEIEKINDRDVLIQIYRDGNQLHAVSIFLDQCLGVYEMSIGVSENMWSRGNHQSCNEIYRVEVENNELYFQSTIAIGNNVRQKNADDITADIWKRFIEPYLKY